MEIVFTVLILMLAVALSGFATSLLPNALPFTLPLPLIQIAIGACLAWPGFRLHVTFDPELFMMLFIPPLLFADGWRIPKREFFMQRRAILLLALGLVFMTVGALGWFLHVMIPAMPLPVAFALAAVLSPTDAVALSGIAGKGRIPANLMHILEGEALMNDASGLVALKFAVAAALTGVFSLRAAAISFVLIAVGGLVIGAAISWLVTSIPGRLVKMSEDDDPAAGVVLTLLIPFAAYLIAERFGCSGILAAVSAGMMMNFQSLREGIPTAARIRMTSTWTMIEFVFNGMVFILLGLQFPHILGRALIEAHHDSLQQVGLLLGYVAAVVIALYGLRFGWVWVLRWVASRGAAKHGVANAVPGVRTVAMT
ncbi:MAG: sodium:proton antiporter, partial [Caballeronia sp.]|uniref:Na+/H+ antiporter n=1 Tax=Caballeronia sp. TaxID=1931223 RepID=UPI0026052BBF